MDTTEISGEHVLVIPRKSVKNVLILVITSDRGLCGGFNNNLIKLVTPWVKEQEAKGHAVKMSFCGRRGYAAYKNRATIERYYEDAMVKPDFGHAHRVAREMQAAFVRGRVDEVYLAYNAIEGAMSQKPVLERLMPMNPATLTRRGAGEKPAGGWMMEPSVEEVLNSLLPRIVGLSVYLAMLNSSVGEHGARMKAMEQASSNADNLIRQITLQRNRARQAAITTELTEIVAGAEALK